MEQLLLCVIPAVPFPPGDNFLRSFLIVLGCGLSCVGVAWLASIGCSPVLGVPAPMAIVGAVFLLNLLAWIPATLLRTERFYDAVGALSHLLAVGIALAAAGGSMRAWTLALPVVVWALRLGSFLARRGANEGDARFEDIKQDPGRFAVAWALQAVWACVTTLAVVVQVSARDPRPLGAWEGVGLAVWALGFGVEWTADRQKSAWRRAHPGTFARGGLWDLSRHPNYVGEIVLWAGLFVAGIPSYAGGGWVAVLSPVFVYGLLRFGSGVPLLEQRADARWGGQADYEAWKARVPVLFPFPRAKR
jgi:steroid 5-alpha reductase family enzyme